MLYVFRLMRVALVLSAALWGSHGFAQGRANIVIVSEDADEDTVPRNNRIFNRVIAELGETMNVRHYNIYDETSVTMGMSEPGRVRRRDTELIDLARAVQQPPLDVIAIFEIYASAKKSTYSDVMHPEVRIPGRLLNVHSGQVIGSFEVSDSQLPPLPRDCDRDCLLEKVGADAKSLAADLGSALSDKLDGFTAPKAAVESDADADVPVPPSKPASGDLGQGCQGLDTSYVIRFQGFSPEEMQAAEEYLSAFNCYEHHRVVRSSANSAEYWYETRSDSARLNRNLRLMLEHMNAGGHVSFAGNTFTVDRVASR